MKQHEYIIAGNHLLYIFAFNTCLIHLHLEKSSVLKHNTNWKIYFIFFKAVIPN